MSWGDHARGKYAASKSVPTGRVAYLIERDEILVGISFINVYTEQSTSAGSFTTIATLSDIPFPVYCDDPNVTSVKLKARVEGKVDANNGYLRMVVGATNGATSSVITSTSYVDVDLEITLPSTITPGDNDLLIQAYNDGGSATYSQQTARAYWWFEVTR